MLLLSLWICLLVSPDEQYHYLIVHKEGYNVDLTELVLSYIYNPINWISKLIPPNGYHNTWKNIFNLIEIKYNQNLL